MNKEQAVIYLATLCICGGRTSPTARECNDRCLPCVEFRSDRELSGKARCIARTKIGRSVRTGYYNGVRSAWPEEVAELAQHDRAAKERPS